LDLTKELVEIGVDESRLAALVQHTMEIEWAVFKSGLMLQYHGLDQDARSIVEFDQIDSTRKMKAIASGDVHQLRALLERFFEQRRMAEQRGIEWRFDFWSWLAVWTESGRLTQRGRRKGQFQMCRTNDLGPYCSTNVRIDLMENNAREAQAAKQRLRLERQMAATAAST
jgi:hypothetical protein